MALFITSRDISFFRGINLELLNNVISTEVDFYKINLLSTPTNIYGEADIMKVYNAPIRLACLVTREDNTNDSNNFGIDDNQKVKFAFLRDGILDQLSLVPEAGDIVWWDNSYFEVDTVVINQLISGKNPASSLDIGPEFGSNWSYICDTHMTRKSKLDLENTNFGNNG